MAIVLFERNVVITDPKKVAELKSALNSKPKKVEPKSMAEDKTKKEELLKKWFCR